MKLTTFSLLLLSAALWGCDGGVAATKPALNAPLGAASAANNQGFTGHQLRLIGRFDLRDHKASFTWPGSAVEFTVVGSQAAINIASQGQVRFVVSVDGGAAQDVWIEAGDHRYSLASNLPAGKHSIRLTRVSESSAGVTAFTSDPQSDGQLAAPSAAPQKHLLVLGDSITAGYGVEGESASCHYALATSNQQLAYAGLAAKALGADLHTMAWSGIGAWRAYGEKTPVYPKISTRYPRILADDSSSLWDISQYRPDAIVIGIGTNDYWDGSAPDDYRLAMAALVAKIQSDYPQKPVYLMISPMLNGKVREAQKAVLTSLIRANVQVVDLGVSDGSDGYGCDYHPNKITQARLAKALEQKLKADLAW